MRQADKLCQYSVDKLCGLFVVIMNVSNRSDTVHIFDNQKEDLDQTIISVRVGIKWGRGRAERENRAGVTISFRCFVILMT